VVGLTKQDGLSGTKTAAESRRTGGHLTKTAAFIERQCPAKKDGGPELQDGRRDRKPDAVQPKKRPSG
jgi:hypothetical protein